MLALRSQLVALGIAAMISAAVVKADSETHTVSFVSKYVILFMPGCLPSNINIA
jgi:hypothetical protein